jgi:endonuclease/exonuclease/phosphatase family metal-dependent hydrolase
LLQSEGLDYPHWEHVSGFDSNIHVAVLSRFPFAARRPHTNEGFLLHGRRFPVSRGFAEVDVKVRPGYRFTLIAAHLKSRRPVPEADQAELREQEALVLRQIIDARLKEDPEANLVVVGDFNDTRDSVPVRTVIGRGRHTLLDTRPAEPDEGPPGPPVTSRPRQVTWTYYFAREDTYSRIDYILVSPGMAREWQARGTCVLRRPDWGIASDHRPVMARFLSEDQ